MRSGYENGYDGIWGNEYYDSEFDEIDDLAFAQKTFASVPALFTRLAEGGRTWQPYHGQEYDKKVSWVEEKGWDHEHCRICQFSIGDGHTYWENTKGQVLCDACHEHYVIADES